MATPRQLACAGFRMHCLGGPARVHFPRGLISPCLASTEQEVHHRLHWAVAETTGNPVRKRSEAALTACNQGYPCHLLHDQCWPKHRPILGVSNWLSSEWSCLQANTDMPCSPHKLDTVMRHDQEVCEVIPS
ncbi:hypothetical protein BJX64DRAFT_125282 [Aspergillus heterothallicus]